MASKQTEILMEGGFLKPGDILIKKIRQKIKSMMSDSTLNSHFELQKSESEPGEIIPAS